MKRLLIIALCLFPAFIWGQNNTVNKAKIIAGPMLGYAEHTECLVWVQSACAKQIEIKYRLQNTQSKWLNITYKTASADLCEPVITKFVLKNLSMGCTYVYQILLDGVVQKFDYNLQFKTKVLWEWRMPPPEFSFMIGSCLYINDSAYDRPGKPYGGNAQILTHMANSNTDFMIWLGDNTYTREADYSSASGIEHRYLHTRMEPKLQALLAKMNHYATWDDHDYGDNDANKHFEFKQVSAKCFKDYWGNKNYGENGEGIYHNFRYSDAEFLLLDDRWFRDETELNESKISKTQLGLNQMSWLKNKLKHSRASFKFVVIGGQFLNENTDKESYNLYRREREEIIQFIVDQKVSGVFFLSGDRHHTELLVNDQVKAYLGYPLYDLTCSSITAGSSNILNTSEAENPQRIAGTLLVENNYCTLKINGSKRGERALTINCFDKDGLLKWTKTFQENELKALNKN